MSAPLIARTLQSPGIYELNDIDRAFYKRLKADEDALNKTRDHIECKKKLVAMYFDIWSGYQDKGHVELADDAFLTKHELEVELSYLIKEERSLLAKIQRNIR